MNENAPPYGLLDKSEQAERKKKCVDVHCRVRHAKNLPHLGDTVAPDKQNPAIIIAVIEHITSIFTILRTIGLPVI